MSGPTLSGNRCACPTCGELFSRQRAFDRHRVGSYAKPGEYQHSRRCLTPDEMAARGWQINAAGFWIMEPLDGAGRARKRAKGHRGATRAAPRLRKRRIGHDAAPSGGVS